MELLWAVGLPLAVAGILVLVALTTPDRHGAVRVACRR